MYDMYVRKIVYQLSQTERRGHPQGGSLFGKASLLYWDTVIKYHSVSDIEALQQHDKAERLGTT